MSKISNNDRYNPELEKIRWRPMIALTYMAICIFDFIIGPIYYNILQFYHESSTQQIEMWVPLTLQGGGLYHLSMGAILGISAYGRTQEKLNGVYYPPTTPVEDTTTQ